MKKILLSSILLVVMLLPISCNKMTQNELPKPQKNELQNQIVKRGTNLSTKTQDFISSFYKGSNYAIGAQVETTQNGVTSLVSEIVVDGEKRARGYILTDVRGNATYFADVDRVNYTLTSVDISTNQTLVGRNINETSKYIETNEYDFIGIISNPPTDEGGNVVDKFWGWGDWEYGPCKGGFRTSVRKHYVFWVVNTRGFGGTNPCGTTLSDDYYGG